MRFFIALLFFSAIQLSAQLSLVEGRACGKKNHLPIELDGKGDDESWEATDWTSSFVDIEGNKNHFHYGIPK